MNESALFLWGEPQRLVWLWSVPFLSLALGLALYKRRRDLKKLADAHILPQVVVGNSFTTQVVKSVLALLVVALVILALARPQWGTTLVEAPLNGADVVLVVDASLSMLSRDAAPDRLSLAKRDLTRLLDSLGPCRIGLVAFAGSGIRQVPLTEDRSAVGTLLASLDPDAVPTAGTDLAKALETAQFALRNPGASRRLVVLVTDGGDHGKGDAQIVAANLKSQGIELVVAGVGGDQAVPIPLREGGMKQDRDGNVVTTRLERDALQTIANAANGKYLELSATAWQLAPVTEIVRKSSGGTEKPGWRREPIERYSWFGGLALLLLLLEMLLPSIWRRRVS